MRRAASAAVCAASGSRQAIAWRAWTWSTLTAQLLIVTQLGYGKRTPLSAFPTKGRGIGGVRALRATPKTGPVAAARVVQGSEELMMISSNGIVIRTPVDTISEYSGRATSGVTVMKLREGDRLAAVALLHPSANGGDEPPVDDPTPLSAVPIAAEEPDVVAALSPDVTVDLDDEAQADDEDLVEDDDDAGDEDA